MRGDNPLGAVIFLLYKLKSCRIYVFSYVYDMISECFIYSFTICHPTCCSANYCLSWV